MSYRIHMLVAIWCSLTPFHSSAQEKPRLELNVGAHTQAVHNLIVTHDDRYVLSTSYDSTVCIWEIATGELVRTLRFPGRPSNPALSEDGSSFSVVVVNEKSKVPVLFQIGVPEGRLLRTDALPVEPRDAQGFLPATSGFAIARTNKLVAFWTYRPGKEKNEDTECRLYVWNVGEQKSNCFSTKARFQERFEGFAPAFSTEFSPNGQHLAVSDSEGMAHIIDLAKAGASVAINERESPVWSIKWSPDSQYVVGQSNGVLQGFVSQWNVKGEVKGMHALPQRLGMGLGNLQSHGTTSTTFSRDGKHLLVTRSYVGQDVELPDTVTVCDFGTDKTNEREIMSQKEGAIWAGAIAARFIVVASGNDLFVLDREDASKTRRLSGSERKIRDAAWRRDDGAIGWGEAVGKLAPPERGFDLSLQELTPTAGQVFERARTAIGNVSIGKGGDFNSEICVLENGVSRGRFVFAEPKIFTMVTEKSAAVVRGASLIELYDLTKRDPKYDMSLVTQLWSLGNTTAIAPSSDGRYILAAQASGILSVLLPGRDSPLMQLYSNKSDWIAWTPEGYYAASPGGENLMGWHVNNGPDQMASFYPASQFRKSLYRPDVIKQLLKAGSVEKAMELADAERGKNGEPVRVADVPIRVVNAPIRVADALPPKVRLTTPERPLGVKSGTLEVKARADSTGNHPVTALHLMIDGRPLPQGRVRIDNPKLGESSATWIITLTAGKQRLSVKADSAVSSAISDEVEVAYQPPDPIETIKLPSLYVLAVGISEYPKELKLNYAHKDAQALAKTLQSHSKALYEKVEVKELLNGQATQREIRKGISWLAKQMTQRDVGVLFLAGHGEIAANGSFYYLPADIDPEDIAATGVPGNEIKDALAAMPGKIIFMLDACHSGGFEGNKKRNSRSLTDELIRDLVADERGVIALCASTGRQFALESNEHRHGMFTLAVIEALQGKAAKVEGAVYLHHLDAYVTDRVKELSQGRQSPTTARPASVRSFPLTRP